MVPVTPVKTFCKHTQHFLGADHYRSDGGRRWGTFCSHHFPSYSIRFVSQNGVCVCMCGGEGVGGRCREREGVSSFINYFQLFFLFETVSA